MRKVLPLTIYTLVTTVMAFSSGTLLAQQPEGHKLATEKLHRGFVSAAPANGMRATDLIDAKVRTSADEPVGSVNDLVIDEKGYITAIVVGVDGLLGMSQKNVAVSWSKAKRSITSDQLELRIDVTPEDLGAAPTFEAQE